MPKLSKTRRKKEYGSLILMGENEYQKMKIIKASDKQCPSQFCTYVFQKMGLDKRKLLVRIPLNEKNDGKEGD